MDTLIWLVLIILNKVDNIVILYSDKLVNIISNLIKIVRTFYYTNETESLNRIIYSIDILCDISDEIKIKIVDFEGVQNLINLFGYLFINDKNSCEIILTSEIILRILNIFINIFTLNSKDIKNIDYSQFGIVLEKLFSVYKMHHSNHYDIQSNLLTLLSNLACFNDIEEIINKILMNNNIIKDLFNYYNKYHKTEVLSFLQNIMIIQHKKVRDFILNMGGFEIIKNNICEYNEDCPNIIEKSISSLYYLIKAEKSFNIRTLFQKLYNTSIPDKIKEIYSDINLSTETEELIKLIIDDCEKYEKSLEE